jgi:hypothetical protein
MNLSWFDNPNGALAADLIESQTLLSMSEVSDPWDQPTKTMWVRNNGVPGSNTPLVDFGLHITCNRLEDLNKILSQGMDKDEYDYPYGLFVIFGYKKVGESFVSYINEFLDGELTAEELGQFQVNWNKGNSALTKIRMKDIPYIYNGASVYINTGNLPIYFNALANANGENRGLLKVLVAIRTNKTLKVDFELVAHSSNQDEA